MGVKDKSKASEPRDAVLIFRAHKQTIDAVPDPVDRNLLRRAILDYLLDGQEPAELSEIGWAVWYALHHDLEVSRKPDGRKKLRKRPDTQHKKLETFLFYRDYMDTCDACPEPDIADEVWNAIWTYGLDGEFPESLSPWAKCIMTAMRVPMDFSRNGLLEKKQKRSVINMFSVQNTIPISAAIEREIEICNREGDRDEDGDDDQNARLCARDGANSAARVQKGVGDQVTKEAAARGSATTAGDVEETVLWDCYKVPPSEEDVRGYAELKGSPDFDAAKFIKFYDANGWTYAGGSQRITDWTITVDAWIKRERPSSMPANGKRNVQCLPVTAKADSSEDPMHAVKGTAWEAEYNSATELIPDITITNLNQAFLGEEGDEGE